MRNDMIRFSRKQRQVLTWWRQNRWQAIICDGAVRSGKTFCMGLSFFLWAQSCFDGRQFALCGKTVGALRRNLLTELVPCLRRIGMIVRENRSANSLMVEFGGQRNQFLLFGGKDESSAALIQGSTLAGLLLDETALMPRSFVEQAVARCSVQGSKLWFNCNPEGPEHWFYKEWIEKAESRGVLRLHFTMADNPGLSPEIRQRYERLYTGVFYRRFILGQWCQAEGRVYDFFDTASVRSAPGGLFEQWVISCDYGTVNPASFGLWGKQNGVWYRTDEFYFDSRREGRQMTDAEYAEKLRKLAGGRTIREVIVDPSAASFIEVLRRNGWKVRKADNDVISGIRKTADALKEGRIVICERCTDCLREMDLYVWDLEAGGDRVVKKNDHAMDDMRYFVTGVLAGSAGFAACVPERKI